jgi:hypothetical protein
MDGPTVQPGQTWADGDKRSVGRMVRVDRIDGDCAICTVVADRSGPRPEGRSPVGRTTWILLRRFKRYRLITR